MDMLAHFQPAHPILGTLVLIAAIILFIGILVAVGTTRR